MAVKKLCLVMVVCALTAFAEEKKPICDGDKVWEPDIKDYITCQDCRRASGYTNCHKCACTGTDPPSVAKNKEDEDIGPEKDGGNYWESRGAFVPFDYGLYMVIGAVFLLLTSGLVGCAVYVVFLRKKIKRLEALPEAQTQVSSV